MYELTAPVKLDLAAELANATVKPESKPYRGTVDSDRFTALAVQNDAAGTLLDNGSAPKIRQVGARARGRDTAADKLFDDILSIDGGALRIIAAPVVDGQNGRKQARVSNIESALDKAYLRLSESDRTRIIYGRTADTTQVVTVSGIDVTAIVPGMIYVMAVGGAVKSHPLMGKVYRAIAGASSK